MDEQSARNHHAWFDFIAWTWDEVNLNAEDSWKDLEVWWSCFMAGYEARTLS